VSQPPEKTRSTTTADPEDGLAKKERGLSTVLYTHLVYKEDHAQTKKG
jgi:hypothetical protein